MPRRANETATGREKKPGAVTEFPPVYVRLDPSARKRLKKRADEEGRTMNEVIRRLVGKYIDGQEES